MKTAQQHAQEILPLVTAQANGEVIQMYVGYHWYDCKEPTAFVYGCKYRIKPRTIIVNGFEVPEPMLTRPSVGTKYYTHGILCPAMYHTETWFDNDSHASLMRLGICHTTKEAAIAHAKAMLGIDPNQECRADKRDEGGFIKRCQLLSHKDGE